MQTCSKCSRANPADAVYCFYDGFAIGGDRSGGPVAVGKQPFNSPFVFPTGKVCRSFDELALACQEEWKGACALLRDGYLESFFGGLGRVDLVVAAKEASKFPDPGRGLDQLLAKLPSSVLDDPKLRVEPGEVNLGLLDPAKERTFDLALENQGMRLLYGTVSSSALWLTLGESPGANEKHFTFTHESKLQVHVWPDRVRAGRKPIEASLLVESNTGPVTVKVRCEKPVTPFPAGPLGGCKTPKQVAEKAQASPKEVAPLFEAGEVEKWYAGNGWQYPVVVPAASGIAAIQQFFEALGVTKAPKVEISQKELSFTGEVGDSIPFTIEVSTQEKRPVFAHVTSNVPWLEVGKPKLTGRTATIAISIPSVPNRPGRTLEAELDVVSNGKARWRVPVTLAIGGDPVDEVEEVDAVEEVEAPAYVAPEAESAFAFDSPAPPPPPPRKSAPSIVLETVPPVRAPVLVPDVPAPPAIPEPPRKKKSKVEPDRGSPRRRAPAGPSVWKHAIPAGLLLLGVLGVIGYDVCADKPVGPGGFTGGLPAVAGPGYDPDRLASQQPRVGISFSPNHRFGVVMLDANDPQDSGRWKRLTFKEDGASNNTVVKIGNFEYLFGRETPNNKMTLVRKPLPDPYKGWISTMDFRTEKIRVMQYLQIVPGADNVLDTVLVYYKAENYGTIPQKVALRLLLDTFIGDNDGVPFTVPGKSGFVTEMATYEKGDIPDYLEVVEKPDNAKDPGTIARLGLKGLSWGEVNLLDPEKVLISRFPGPDRLWDWEPEPMGDDSSVAIYWPEKLLNASSTMSVALTYGLGKLDITDQLALSAPAAAQPGRDFVVTAYVYNAKQGQKITLDLPPGLKIVDGSKPEQTIAKDESRTQIFWKVRAAQEGKYPIGATSDRSRAKPITVAVQSRSIFG